MFAVYGSSWVLALGVVGSTAGGAVGESLQITVPISLLMASVDLVLSSSSTSPSAGPAGYFSQIKKTKILYHIMILVFARTTPQH